MSTLRYRAALAAVCWTTLLCSPRRGEAQAPPPETVRADALGDPLPAGAVARLGNARLRHGESVTVENQRNPKLPQAIRVPSVTPYKKRRKRNSPTRGHGWGLGNPQALELVTSLASIASTRIGSV